MRGRGEQLAHGGGSRALLLALLLWVVVASGAAARAQGGPPAAPLGPVQESAPTVTAIEVQGLKRYTKQRILDALGQKVGQPLDEDLIDKGLVLLWRSFYVRAEVQKRATPEGVELLLIVTELPSDLEPRFIGNDEIDQEQLLEWARLGDKDQRELYLHETPRVRQRLLDGYRREGYYHAEVREVVRQGGIDADGNEFPPDVIFEIVEGPQVRVREVVVHGNRSFPERGFWFWKDGLKHLAKTELGGPWIFNWKGDRYVEEVLQADIIAMRQVYRDRGFLDAVVELDHLEFSDDRSRVTVHVIVDEGKPYTVGKVSLVAVSLEEHPRGPGFEPVEKPAELLFEEAELRALLKLSPGERYEKTRVEADGRALREHYGKRGYISHPSLGIQRSFEFLEPRYVFDVEAKTVDVTYRIVQGRKVNIREVLFAGATHTRDRVLRREVAVEEGEQADLTKIQTSVRRLRGTGYFSDPRRPLEHQEPTYRFVPTEDPEWVDIEFVVEEGSVVNFEVSGGVDSNNGLFGIISLSMRNFDVTDIPDSFFGAFGEIYRKEAFHGAGQQLDIQFSPGTAVDYTRVRFLEPDLFRNHRRRWVLDLEFLDRERAYREYDEDRIRRSAKLGHVFRPDWTVFLGYSNEDVEVSDLDLTDELPQALIDQQGSTALQSGSIDLVYRSVDSRINPREGISFTWSNSLYGEIFGGDADFYKGEIGIDYYLPTTSALDVRPGFRLSAGFGYGVGIGETEEIPYTERFFLGGLRSLRGFRFRGVGPNVGDTPIGGQTMLRGTVEYGIPLYSITRPGTYERVEMVRFVLFTDAGVLDEQSGSIDFGEYRASSGFGFGLTQPFPILFNFGWPLRKGEGDRTQVFSFNLAFL